MIGSSTISFISCLCQFCLFCSCYHHCVARLSLVQYESSVLANEPGNVRINQSCVAFVDFPFKILRFSECDMQLSNGRPENVKVKRTNENLRAQI